MTPAEKADRAKLLLEDELLLEVFAGMREKLIARLEGVGISDAEQQRDIIITLQVLKQIPEALRRFIADGEMVKYRQRDEEFRAQARQRL